MRLERWCNARLYMCATAWARYNEQTQGQKKAPQCGARFIYVQRAFSYSLLLFFRTTAIPLLFNREPFSIA
jgi:hypothetical protein